MKHVKGDPPIERWEYETSSVLQIPRLQALGEEGWELVIGRYDTLEYRMGQSHPVPCVRDVVLKRRIVE